MSERVKFDLTDNSASNNLLSHRVSLGRRPTDNGNPSRANNDNHNLTTVQRNPNLLERRISGHDAAYDTDGGTNARRAHLHHHIPNYNVDSLVSPRNVRRTAFPPSSTNHVPIQHRPVHRIRLVPNQTNHEEREDDYTMHDEGRQSVRVQHRAPLRPARTTLAAQPSIMVTPPTMIQSPATPPGTPLRLIFMRHAERMDQAIGREWYRHAFTSNGYRALNENMPHTLPPRQHEQHFQYDVPLTVRGLESAHLTGRALKIHGYLPTICLSSTSLRCVQTADQVLSGMNLRDQLPIRIEPSIFECPHSRRNLVESFMKRKELGEIYNIKLDYKPILDKFKVPESLEEYFDRSAKTMGDILKRYGRAGETVLIVTHAPGVLALTDALKQQRPAIETFYPTVATYPPLAVFMAEYDGIKWKYSEQPYNILSAS